MTVMEDPHVRTLFTQSPLPMWVCDFDSRQILDINESMLKLLNCSREDFFCSVLSCTSGSWVSRGDEWGRLWG